MLPTNDEMNLVDSLRSQYSTLKETPTTQRPSNFWDQIEVLDHRIKALEPKLKEKIKLISDAASCYHLASAMEEFCLTADDIKNGRAWNEVVHSLTCLGVPDIINVLTQRKKDEQMMAAAAAAFKKQQQAVAVAAATAAETVHQHPLDSESNSEFLIMKFSNAKTHKKIDDNKIKIIVLAFSL